MLTSRFLVNPVTMIGGAGVWPDCCRTEFGVDSACCVIGWEHMRST